MLHFILFPILPSKNNAKMKFNINEIPRFDSYYYT